MVKTDCSCEPDFFVDNRPAVTGTPLNTAHMPASCPAAAAEQLVPRRTHRRRSGRALQYGLR